jgi:hypothetical protein
MATTTLDRNSSQTDVMKQVTSAKYQIFHGNTASGITSIRRIKRTVLIVEESGRSTSQKILSMQMHRVRRMDHEMVTMCRAEVSVDSRGR